ncbi:hypothetical protein DH2020_014982 [Rehmannia glutinosa]|uniref:Polyadenylate-binding protein n=1 Tax=Rehmannia glutinosa TaxID=99300 RepID=A0ABR0WY29_REHGL
MAAEPTVPAATPASLYVGDLHQDVTDGMLYDVFAEFKSISVRVCRDSSTGRSLGYGYVNFLSPQDAIRAIEAKNHSSLNGRMIRVMWSHRDPDSRRSGIGNVFVKNLSDSIDCAKLQEMFQEFGDILSCKVVTSDDGKSKGYGFVQFESESSAKAAIEKLNGSTSGGKQMFVGKFVKKSDRAVPSHEAKYANLYVKNLDTSFSEEVLKEKFSQYGKIVSLVISKDENGASRGFGFVNFENPDDAKCAVEALHGSQLDYAAEPLVLETLAYNIRIQQAQRYCMLPGHRKNPSVMKFYAASLRRKGTNPEIPGPTGIIFFRASNVYVKNIDDDVIDDELKLHFSQCGTITSAKIMRDDKGVSKGFGFVCFSTPEEANKAVYTFHGFILRRKPLYVAIAQRKEERQAQLQLIYAQRMAGLAGPSAVIPGGYSHYYYPASGVVSQIPAQTALMYQPTGIRPGWRANGIANLARPAVHSSPVTLAPNNSRQHRQNRGRMSAGPAGLTYASHMQQPTYSVGISKDSSNHQHVGHFNYDPNGHPHEINIGSTSVQPIVIAGGLGAEGSEMLSSLLAAAPPAQQKHILGDRLYPLVSHHQPDLAAKITGMLLEMDNSELLVLLDSPEALAAKVEEAVEVLKLSKAKVPNQNTLRSKYISTEVAVN